MRYFFLIILLQISLATLADGTLSFSSDIKKNQYYHLIREIRCVVCQNQSIADSNAALANDLRRKVYEQLMKGRSEKEIKKYLIDRYGDSILFSPPFNTRTIFLWAFPFLMLLSVIGFFFVIVRKK